MAGLLDDELDAFFGNPNLKRQTAKGRASAAKRDVNTLPDPRTFAAMQGLLGARPDEMGFSVLHPEYQQIMDVANPAYGLGLAAQLAPVLAPFTKGLPVGASVKNVGFDPVKMRTQYPDRLPPVLAFDSKSKKNT